MDRSERDRAAMAQAGLAPVLLADAACPGHRRISGQTIGLCINCGRLGAQGPQHIQPAAFLDGSGSWDCPNRRSLGALLDAETVAAVDETGGIHATHCAPVQGGEKALPVGAATAGCTESQRHSGVVSTRAGEGGACAQ